MKRKLLSLFAIFSVLLAITGCQIEDKGTNPEVKINQNEELRVELLVTLANNSETVSKVEVEFKEGDNLLYIMQKNLKIVDNAGFITSIEGVEAKTEDKMAWFFQINGEDSMVGAGDYKLKNGDKIHWDLHSWE